MRKDRDIFNDTVLITGATSGLGLELAREFARHRHPLILIAPGAMELVALAQHFHEKYAVQVLPLAEDLTQPEIPGRIFAQLQADGLPVGILVNHAGVGEPGRFDRTPLESDVETVRFIEAGVRLTKLFLPAMISQRRGRILNTAVAASAEAGPLRAVGVGARAFMVAWSESLAASLASLTGPERPRSGSPHARMPRCCRTWRAAPTRR
jgi:short-subunit dehydrogenase